MNHRLRILALLGLFFSVSGCVVATVVDTTVDVASAAVGTTVNVAAGAIDLAVPDGDEED